MSVEKKASPKAGKKALQRAASTVGLWDESAATTAARTDEPWVASRADPRVGTMVDERVDERVE